MKTTSRWMTRLIAVCLSFAGFVHSAQATLVTTEQVAASEGVTGAAEQRAHVYEMLTRADVAAALQERGVDMEQAKARVAALTDAEVAHVAHTLDTAPAGASDVIGTIVFIFLLLLITDILGFTKIFPFTRSIR
ncbi:PA2779 family protein [Rhizobacter sp. AJA081-3]|uniref:PA2779 family protein n=1 Tax=Rhizobacter sp. AJA081-3 TaxID=2753607 RepID=UPI001ADF189B|nr:PA2779 family protein [Rhizobacter sp. AJA081-3]QTN21290.1 PA2779 family protein [Rhizobacter sp. AJA081-3]